MMIIKMMMNKKIKKNIKYKYKDKMQVLRAPPLKLA